MMRRFFRSFFFRALALLAGTFVGGWLAQGVVQPRPRLMQDMWRESAAAAGQPKPKALVEKKGVSSVRVEAGKTAAPGAGKAAFSLENLLAMVDPLEEIDRLSEHLKTCELKEVEALFASLQKLGHREMRMQALNELFRRWAQLDPAAALAGAQTLGRESLTHSLGIWREWGGQDVDGALASAKAAGKLDQARREILRGMARKDPLQLLERWKELKPSGTENQLAAETLAAAARKSPERALAALGNLPADVLSENNDYGGRKTAALVKSILAKDPAAGLRQINGVADEKQRTALLAEAAEQIAKTDPAEAARLAREQPEGEGRRKFAQSAAGGMAEKDPVGALHLFTELAGAGALAQTKDLSWLVDPVSKPTAAQASALLAEVPPGPARDKLYQRLLGKMQNENPEEGRAWLTSQPVASLDPEALIRAGRFIPKEQWGPYLDAVDKLPEAKRREGLAKYAEPAVGTIGKLPQDTWGQEVAALDPRLQPAAARALLEKSAMGGEEQIIGGTDEFGRRVTYVKDANGRYVPAQPDMVKGRAVFDSLPPTAQQGTATYVASGIYKQDPAGAAEVLTSHPQPPDDPAAALLYENVAREWLKKDSLAASQWIGTLQPGAARDAAAFSLVENTIHDDPAAAQTWAATIQDPVTQQRAAQLFQKARQN